MNRFDFRRFFKILPGWAKVLLILGYPIHLFFRWVWSWFQWMFGG